MDTTGTPPVSAADVDLAVALAADALLSVVDQDWAVPAGELEWSCRETVEHIADDLFAYAGQLGPRRPPLDTYVPFGFTRRTPAAPALAVYVTAETGNEGLVQVLEACGTCLSAVVTTARAQVRAWHPMGVSDPEGFAAMGVVEVLVHMRDVAAGLGFDWTPPEDLCDRVLYRLFPSAPSGGPRWQTMLWATGRGELPGQDPVGDDWRWYGEPRPAEAG